MNLRERVRERLINYMKVHACSTSLLAEEIGVAYATLLKLIDGSKRAHMRTLLKVELFLDRESV